MNNKVFKLLINSSNFDNLKIALNELTDSDLLDRIGIMIADKNEILTRQNIDENKLIKFIEDEYECRRNIAINNVYNIDNFNGRVYANISYDKVKFSKIENDTKESNNLQNYPDEEYKYPVIIDHYDNGSVSVSFIDYQGNTKDIFDYNVIEINKNELQC